MDSDSSGQLIYLIFLGLAIGIGFLAMYRTALGTALRQGAVWLVLFVGLVAGYGIWSDIRADGGAQQMVYGEEGRIEVPRARDGSYYLTLEVNGTPISFIVDTGASEIVLTREDAARAGLGMDSLDFFATATTANGEVKIAPVRLDQVQLGAITDRNVRASVNGGELFHSLLGMSYLNRFERIEIAQNRLILTR